MRPSEHVLDMFAVPGDLDRVPGGQGHSVCAGDLLLSPGRDPATHDELNPRLARLAVDLDTRPGRDRRDLRIAMPVPARDGSWVIDGWGATRYEPGTRQLTDLTAVRAVGAVLHAELARAVRSWTGGPREDRWAAAERIAFDEAPAPDTMEPLLAALVQDREAAPLGPAQLVHGDLAGNVLIDPHGAPVVVDVSPYWRPALWADAVVVLDCVMAWDADPHVLDEWVVGARRQAMVRAAIFRILSDQPADVSAYERVLEPLLGDPRP